MRTLLQRHVSYYHPGQYSGACYLDQLAGSLDHPHMGPVMELWTPDGDMRLLWNPGSGEIDQTMCRCANERDTRICALIEQAYAPS